MKVNYFGKFAIFSIKSGKFYNSFDSEKKAVEELQKLNKKNVAYEIYAPRDITILNG